MGYSINLSPRWHPLRNRLMPWRTGELPRWLQGILIRSQLLQRLFFRYYCPYPILEDRSARACVEAGKCGCNNQDRYAQIAS